jgi:hypothetical protein
MCDYSLGGLPNRLAVEGEALCVHRFPTGSMGLASLTDLNGVAQIKTCERSFWQSIKNFFQPQISLPVPAVCVPPGAHLVWKSVHPDVRREWGIEEEEEAVFMQTSADVNRYRDALRLANGRQALLQDLHEGMLLQVLTLGGAVEGEAEPAMSLIWR